MKIIKIVTVSVALFLTFAAGLFWAKPNDNVITLRYNWDNTRCLLFYDLNIFIEPLDIRQRQNQIDRWKFVSNVAVSLLPNHLLTNSCLEGHKIQIAFWTNSESLSVGNVNEKGDVFINLTPNWTKWIEWRSWEERSLEPKDELVSKIYLVLHEIGHVYEQRKHYYLFEELYDGDKLKPDSEKAPTKYAEVQSDKGEDFADSFVFYILWPGYLKQHFPQRYAVIQGLIGKELPEPGFKMPGWLEDRSTVNF